MQFKDIKNILFFPLIVLIISGCVPESKSNDATRILIGANIEGKIFEDLNQTPPITAGLARLGGMVDELNKGTSLPTVSIQLGNSVEIENEKHIKTAELISKGAQMIGFQANLSSILEFSDTAESAKKRAATGWKQVVSNLKPKDGVTPPVSYELFHYADPGNGRLVYFFNFISRSIYLKHNLLNENYEWIDPAIQIKELVRKIRKKDIVVVYYQTDTKVHLIDLYKVQEAQYISCLILNMKFFDQISARRPKNIENVNLVRKPANLSTVEAVVLNWKKHEDKWNMITQRMMLSSYYPKSQNIEKLLSENGL